MEKNLAKEKKSLNNIDPSKNETIVTENSLELHDMSRKERRKYKWNQEKEKIKELTFWRKVQYIFNYYTWKFLAVVAVIAIIGIIIQRVYIATRPVALATPSRRRISTATPKGREPTPASQASSLSFGAYWYGIGFEKQKHHPAGWCFYFILSPRAAQADSSPRHRTNSTHSAKSRGGHTPPSCWALPRRCRTSWTGQYHGERRSPPPSNPAPFQWCGLGRHRNRPQSIPPST